MFSKIAERNIKISVFIFISFCFFSNFSIEIPKAEAAISHIGTINAGGEAVSSYSFDLSTLSCQNGDLLIVSLAVEQADYTYSFDLDNADWALISNNRNGSRAHRNKVWWNTIDGWNITVSSIITLTQQAEDEGVASLVVIRGSDIITPFDTASERENTSSTGDPLSTAKSGFSTSDWVLFGGSNMYGTTYTPPSGWDGELADNRSGTGSGNISTALCYETGVTSISADLVYNAASNDYWNSWTVVLYMPMTHTLTTEPVTNAEATTVVGNGTISGIYSYKIRGFVYMTGTTGYPTTSNSVAYDDGLFQTGAYTKQISSLSSGTYYRVRAYIVDLFDAVTYGTTVQTQTKPAAPTSVAATDGAYTDKVTITWTKSTGATDYHVWRDSTDLGSAGDVATFDDSGADAPTITAGSASASDGTSAAHVALSLSGASANNGTSHTYKVVASNVSGNSADSTTDTGYRGVGSLTYQWQRSAADSDASYSDITDATTASYNDTGAPADGSGRYFKCVLNATGASQQTSTSDRGYRLAGTLSVLIVDGSGTEVSSPAVSFSGKNFDWSGQQSAGVLGFSTPTVEKVRVSNTTGSPGWTLSISATDGSSAIWSDGSNDYDFNDSSSTGRLEVDPSSATITPQGGCSATGLNKQSAAYFDSGNSVDIIITSGSEEASCYWDITGVDLTQDIPASQEAGDYSINMTLTVT